MAAGTLKSYKFESYAYITATTATKAWEKLRTIFECFGLEWELTETRLMVTPPASNLYPCANCGEHVHYGTHYDAGISRCDTKRE